MRRAKYNPDCGYGWIVVAACFSLNFIMAGLVRAAGVLYVALIDEYGVSREVATMPFSIRFCVRNMSGPLVGAMGQRFGIRPVVILGGFVCGLGGILSAFAPNVTWITFAWGGIHGLGYGMCNIIHVIVINRYFHKYKGLALGINYSGDCFGTFILPLLLEFLLEMYNLSGTFLILAGISLNVLPFAMLLVPPPWEDQDSVLSSIPNTKEQNMNNKQQKQGYVNECFDSTSEESNTYRENEFPRISVPTITVSEETNHQNQVGDHQTSPIFENDQDINSKHPRLQFLDFYSHKQCPNHLLRDPLVLNEIHCLRKSTSLRVPEKNMKKKRLSCQINMNRKSSQISIFSIGSCPSYVGKPITEKMVKNHQENPDCDHLQSTKEIGYLSPKAEYSGIQRGRRDSVSNSSFCMKPPCILNGEESLGKTAFKTIPLYEEEVLNTLERVCDDADTKSEIFQTNEKIQQNPVMRFLRTNTKPMFLIMSATMAFFVFLFISVFTIIIDYAADNGIEREYGKYLIIAFSVTDAIGRIGFGVVIDKKWLSLHYYAGVTTGIMGLCIFIIPLFKCFTFWIIAFSVCGFVEGGTAIVFPVLVEHYMEKNEVSVALGCLQFYGGLLMLPMAPMIGFFRDDMGSYDGVFWIVGALCIFAGSLWIFEPCIVRKKEKELCINNDFSNKLKI